MIDPIEMRVAWYVFCDMGLDRQNSTSVQNIKGAIWRRRRLKICADMQQIGGDSLRKDIADAAESRHCGLCLLRDRSDDVARRRNPFNSHIAARLLQCRRAIPSGWLKSAPPAQSGFFKNVDRLAEH